MLISSGCLLQTENVLKGQLKRIQDLESELHRAQLSGASSRPQTGLSSLSLADVDAMSTLSGYTDITSSSASTLETEIPGESGVFLT
jgi:hypothetical protein